MPIMLVQVLQPVIRSMIVSVMLMNHYEWHEGKIEVYDTKSADDMALYTWISSFCWTKLV
jgi:hypothetical protein